VIVAVANLKGGVGKTTSSVLLAHALTAATGDRCVVIDADPQGSAAQWAKVAAEAGRPLSVPVLAQPTSRLAKMANAAPYLVIDTPPAYSDALEAAIAVADFVLIPTSASAMDLSAIRATVAAARRVNRPAAVVLTRTRRVRSVGSAEHELRAEGIDVLAADIPLREALAMAFGRPVRELFGYDRVAEEIVRRADARPRVVAPEARRVVSVPAIQPRPLPHPVPVLSVDDRRPEPASAAVGLADDDDLILRLRSSMARLAARR
jgi:chromosome partitioning protein